MISLIFSDPDKEETHVLEAGYVRLFYRLIKNYEDVTLAYQDEDGWWITMNKGYPEYWKCLTII